MDLSLNYIIDQIYKFSYSPKFKKYSNVYNFSCPVCKEGTSFGKKMRGFYLVKENYFICHNCQKTWSPLNWIKEVTGLSIHDILVESSNYTDSLDNIILKHKPVVHKQNVKIPSLPHDCINLTDSTQLQFYKDNNVVNDALAYIDNRRLLTAINRPKAYYISLTDPLHKNRLIIPFHNELNKIVFYQSRALYPADENVAKYLSKANSQFTVFGINRINPNIEYLFLFEGPIDSCFVQNGLGLGGLRLTELQEKQLTRYRLYTKIWVLDNQLDNKTVLNKYKELINKNELVFCIPDKFKEFKDLNEICVKYKLDQVSPKFIKDNSFTGVQATLKLKIPKIQNL